MVIVPIVLLGCASLAMSVIYSFFKDKGDWQGYLVRSLTMLLLLIYAVVTINLTSIINALSLFIAIALVVNIFNEGLKISNVMNAMAKQIMEGVSLTLFYLSLALSTLSLASFDVFSLLGGLLLGGGVGLLISGLKKEKSLVTILFDVLCFASVGLAIGFGLNSIINTNHLTSAVLTLVAMVMLLTSELLSRFLKNGKLKNILCSELKIVALIILVLAIYLFK